MRLPFHNVQVCGDVLFAARGGNIHSFKLTDGSHISCWKYPIEKKDGNGKPGVSRSEDKMAIPSHEDQGPPAKRVKLDAPAPAAVGGAGNGDSGDAAAHDETRKVEDSKPAEENGNDTPVGQKKGKKQGPRPGPMSQPLERPLVIILTATNDDRHVVAVTQCKSIWVFEHDGHGQLKQLSRRYVAIDTLLCINMTIFLFRANKTHTLRRTMPKRPCSLVLTPDNETILSADKFGDVYSLPLIPSENPPVTQPKESSPAAPSPSPAPAPAQASPSPAPEKQPTTTTAYKPQASELTVHTKRNRQALLDQQLYVQNPNRNRGGTQKAEVPTFERTLLLGHVSLLTAVCLATDPQGRPYIITADRDEHIRVSRGTTARGGQSQAHVIEAFCLGHEDFVNRLCVPPAADANGVDAGFGDLLVSGGGDTDLFVWRWREGALLARTPMLAVVKEIVPEAAKVAVSGLWCWSGGPVEGKGEEEEEEKKGITVLVVCERYGFTPICAFPPPPQNPHPTYTPISFPSFRGFSYFDSWPLKYGRTD